MGEVFNGKQIVKKAKNVEKERKNKSVLCFELKNITKKHNI